VLVSYVQWLKKRHTTILEIYHDELCGRRGRASQTRLSILYLYVDLYVPQTPVDNHLVKLGKQGGYSMNRQRSSHIPCSSHPLLQVQVRVQEQVQTVCTGISNHISKGADRRWHTEGRSTAESTHHVFVHCRFPSIYRYVFQTSSKNRNKITKHLFAWPAVMRSFRVKRPAGVLVLPNQAR
jgi:hypothetical protein